MINATQATNQAHLAAFNAQVDKFTRAFPLVQHAIVKNIVLALAENIIVGGAYGPGTPIDTSFARNSWYLNVDTMYDTRVSRHRNVGSGRFSKSPDQEGGHLAQEQGLDGTGQQALQTIALTLLRTRPGVTVYLLNNAPYIRRLEYGWSKQAPAGMVRVVMANGQTLVNQVVMTMAANGQLRTL